MFLEDGLATLLDSSRSEVIKEYVQLNRTLVGSKFSQDEQDILAERINHLVDKFIEALVSREDNIFLDYAKSITGTRLKEGYDVKAVLRLWDWGLEFFPHLIERKISDGADKTSYTRRLQSMLIRAKLVVANANLDNIEAALQQRLQTRKPEIE